MGRESVCQAHIGIPLLFNIVALFDIVVYRCRKSLEILLLIESLFGE